MFLLLKQWQACFWSSLFVWFYLTKQITVIRLNLNLSWRMGIYSWFVFVFIPTGHFCFTLHPSGEQHSNGKTHMILSQMLTYLFMPRPAHLHSCIHTPVYLSIYLQKEREKTSTYSVLTFYILRRKLQMHQVNINCTVIGRIQFSSVQSLSRVRLFVIPWIAAHQASLSITNSQSSLRFTSIDSVMPSSHLILCCPLLLLPPIPPSISLFQWVNSSHEVAKVLEFQL